MVEHATLETFTPLLGASFTVGAAEDRQELVLVEAVSLGVSPGVTAGGEPLRAPFSLVFAGPIQPILPQRTYALHNSALGAIDIFIVPIGPGNERMRYQAVFA